MKLILKRSLQLGTISLLCFGLFKGVEFYRVNKSQRHIARKSQSKEEKSFVILVPSYNNAVYCEKNLASIVSQNYQNFRIIYIDDASSDTTLEKVVSFVEKSPLASRIQILHNEHNKGALENVYHAVHSCRDEEIVVIVDGDDFLAHENVLSKLNKVYSSSATWLTYGNFLDYPGYQQKPLICKPFPKRVMFNNGFRSHPFVSSHLRTFYAGLFKLIRREDLSYKGGFFPMAGDVAIMIPMLEMSGKHTRFIKEVLYLYNRTNPISDHVKNLGLQSECANYVKNLPKYKRLKSLPCAGASSEPREKVL